MTANEFLFGDTLDRAADHIVSEAVITGTAAAFKAAAHKLHGITTFYIFMGNEAGALSDPIIRLGNLRTRMHQLADNDDFREWALPEMRANRNLTI